MGMLQEWNDLFTALLYGNGAWIGLAVFLAIFIVFMLKWKYSGILFIPVAVFMGLEYLDNSLEYHGFIMLSSSVFMLLFMIQGARSR